MATLTELRQRSRERADMELGPGQADTDHFIKNSELDSYINASIAELYDLIVKANGDYYTIPSTPFTTTAEQQESDVKWKRIRRYNLKDRYRGGMLKYRLRAGNIEFNTDPGAGRTIRLLYIPKSTTLVSGSDTFDGINAFEEYVVVDAAIKMLTKEESDTSTLYAQKVALIERIHEMADDRDSGESETITDLYMTDTLDSRGWTMDDE
jgi:hypothetical protein